jgi:hypothetical protein
MADGTDGFSQAVKVMEFLVVAGKGGHILGPNSEVFTMECLAAI